MTDRNYTNEPSGSETPDVDYFYGTTAPKVGKLTKVSSSVSTTEYTSFDILGRVTASKQTTDGGDTNGYSTGYTYKLSGALDEQTYPSGRVVKNELDASGDLSLVTSKENSSAIYKTYANDFTYTAVGAVSSLKLGNGRFESTAFNSRLQPTQIALGSSVGNAGLLKIDYTYNSSGNNDNNGNLLSQTITVPGLSHPFVQTYTYDELNRLKSATETNNSTQTWKQTFTFDRYGNRRFDETNTTMPTSFSNQALTNPTISTSNNRMTSTGWTYDSAGNTVGDPDGRTLIYDAENKQVEVKNSGNASLGTYFFDGDGKRVKKVVPSTGETTIFVYDAGAKLIGEYSTIVQNSSNAKVQYLTQDNLGTPRINTDAIGAVTSRSDYLPYGEELTTQGGRSSSEKYQADDVRQGFTGYENDEETGLDFAQARIYDSSLGRYSGVDPLISSGRAEVPQTWNRYSYALNSPAIFKDPTGKDIIILIWATEDGKIGHAGIAIANYKTEKKTVNGKTVETKVADGTYTYRDLWPGGDGAGPTNFDKDIPAEYGQEFAKSLTQLLNSDITGSEGYAPDGAIRLNTGYETDTKVQGVLDRVQVDNPNYNGITMNCADFVQRGVEAASRRNLNADESVFSKTVSTGSITQDRLTGGREVPVYSTTPNMLFKAARGLANATVIKDPGSKVDNPFTRSVLTGAIKRSLKP
jgi:RHS repeat-associated protein